MQKAVFIDHKEGELNEQVFQRIAKNFQQTAFVMSDDPNKLEIIKDADALFVKISSKIDRQVIDSAPKLKFIDVCSTAYDAVDAKYAREKGVAVCNLGGYSTEAVAEFFFATLLEHSRELERAKNQARKGDYGFQSFLGLELKDKTLGVIGAGAIGSRIAQIGLGFGMKILYFSRKNKELIEKWGAQKAELNEVLSKSDLVSLNLSLNGETSSIISAEKIALLKPGCIFINLAPPNLIDEPAMMTAARSGKLTFIFDHSDDSKYSAEFLKTPNCIVYPAIAFRTIQADINRWEAFASNIENFIAGQSQNMVN